MDVLELRNGRADGTELRHAEGHADGSLGHPTNNASAEAELKAVGLAFSTIEGESVFSTIVI